MVCLSAVQRRPRAAAIHREIPRRAFPTSRTRSAARFAAMLSAMDDAVGAVLAKIREHGLEENTLDLLPQRQRRADARRPLPATARCAASRRRPGKAASACRGWCSGRATSPAGKVDDRPVIQLDILPTALAAAGVAIQPEWKLDGVNLLPYLTGAEVRAAARGALLAVRPADRHPHGRLETGQGPGRRLRA